MNEKALVLVVDDCPINVKLITTFLKSANYQVVAAFNGEDALVLAEQRLPDVILLDVMMLGLDGYAVTRRLKANPATRHIPLALLSALDSPESRAKGFNAGADEILAKPVVRAELLARVETLQRVKQLQDKLVQRQAITRALTDNGGQLPCNDETVLVIEDNVQLAGQIEMVLRTHEFRVKTCASAWEAEQLLAQSLPDLIILDVMLTDQRSLDLLDELKSHPVMQSIPVLVVTTRIDLQTWVQAIQQCADDYLVKPVEQFELVARVRASLAHAKANQQLRRQIEQLMVSNVTDPLTNLHNRQYLDADLDHRLALIKRQPEQIFAVVMVDIDHFKAINDQFGHVPGDAVLKRISALLRESSRHSDVVSRYGGEEFCVVMPDTTRQQAIQAAERMRQAIDRHHFEEAPGHRVTASFGVTTCQLGDDSITTLIQRADQALYQAKTRGRNRVEVSAIGEINQIRLVSG